MMTPEEYAREVILSLTGMPPEDTQAEKNFLHAMAKQIRKAQSEILRDVARNCKSDDDSFDIFQVADEIEGVSDNANR